MLAVFGLFLLAPFVGEFLLGNLTLDQLWLGVLLIPLYGCGAVLVREFGRRAGGWPTMALLAVAYALIEEGPVDQLLWNDSYAGHNYLEGPTFIPWLGMNAETTLVIVALHGVWSICVPIAIVESFVPARRTTPWLGRTGLIVVGIVYALGATLVFFGNYAEEKFLASPGQLIGITVVIVGLIVAAFRVRKLPLLEGKPPSPRVVGAFALGLTSAFWAPAVLIAEEWVEWVTVGMWVVAFVSGVLLISRWSRQQGWSQLHIFALAAGATLTYTWLSFPVRPELGGPLTTDLATNAVCAAIALTVLVLAARKARVQPALPS